MSEREEDLSRRLHAARAARLSAQRTRLLALERADKLERELKIAAESGLRTEISRSLEARASLQSVAKRKSASRYSAFAAFALLLGVATLGIGWAPSQNAAEHGPLALQAPVLADAPGDRLKLAYSYDITVRAAR